ncbi:MAG: DMT family transporter [Planctomycetota bacterium]
MTRPTALTSPSSADAHQAEARHQRIGFGFALGAAALFSLTGGVVKLGLDAGVGVETLMLWRMGLALPVYLAVGGRLWVGRRRAGGEPTPRRVLLAAAGLGVLSYYVCSWLDFTGLRFITAQLERMILFTYPALTAVLAWLLTGQRFTRRHAAALGVAYAGVLLVFGSERQAFGPGVAWGVGLVFAAALLFALYVIYAKPVIGRMGPAGFTCVAMTAATVAIVTHQAVRRHAVGEPLASAVSVEAVVAGAVLAVGCTVLPSFMLSAAIGRIGPQRASAAGNVGPVVTTVLAVWLLGEPFGVAQAAGLALILVGVGLVAKRG